MIYSNSIINDAKKKASSFTDNALSKITEKCYEDALFVAYADNLRKCPDLGFSSLLDWNEKFKRKFDLRLRKHKETL